MVPPMSVMMPWTVDNPSPVPLPGGLVVKMRSKIRGLTSALMPIPVPLTASST